MITGFKTMRNCIVFVILLQTVCVFGAKLRLRSDKEWPRRELPHFKYTIDELLRADFPKKTSNDLYLDPCKSGKTVHKWIGIFQGQVIDSPLFVIFNTNLLFWNLAHFRHREHAHCGICISYLAPKQLITKILSIIRLK